MSDGWKSNYKSMSVPALRAMLAVLPTWLTLPERDERAAYIAEEIRIRANKSWELANA